MARLAPSVDVELDVIDVNVNVSYVRPPKLFACRQRQRLSDAKRMLS
jgi:hypothetical protein